MTEILETVEPDGDFMEAYRELRAIQWKDQSLDAPAAEAVRA